MSGLSCGTQDLHCITQDLSLRCTDSLVVALGRTAAVCWLSCSAECGKLISPPGIESMSPALQSESHSAVSDSLRDSINYIVHGILQARRLESVLPLSRGSSQPKDRTQVSRIARQILNHWTTREVPLTLVLIVVTTIIIITSSSMKLLSKAVVSLFFKKSLNGAVSSAGMF